MHILLIPSWYKTKEEPMMGTFFEEQARTLMKAGHKAGIIYPEYSSVSALIHGKEKIDSYEVDNGLPTYKLSVRALLPGFRYPNYQHLGKAVEKVFYDYVDQHGRPDIIHAHSAFYGGIAAFYIATKHKIPLVITEHLTAFIVGSIDHKDDKRIAVKIFEDADAAIIVSNNFKRDIEKALRVNPHAFTVIHNLVADLFFENVSIKPYNTQEDFVFFTNAFLLPRKNHKMMLDAFKLLLEKKPKVKLRIGGDGPLYDELVNYTKELGIENNVVFLRAVSRRQVKEELDNCHAFVLASLYETFGVVLIESLACGRPVVCTDSGGPRDIVTKTDGLLIKEFKPAALASAMEKIINDYSRYDQLKISNDCFSRFNEKKIEHEIEALYIKVLESRKIKVNS